MTLLRLGVRCNLLVPRLRLVLAGVLLLTNDCDQLSQILIRLHAEIEVRIIVYAFG